MTLKRRLVLFFMAVVALGAFATFALVRLSTETLFRSLVFSGDSAKAERYAALLGEFYQANGSWSGVGPYIVDSMTTAYAGHAGMPSFSDRIVLADQSGIVVADSSGELLGSGHPPRHLEHGIPVVLGSERKGTVMVGTMVDSALRGTDERFLFSVTASLLASTLLSAGLAFLLGLVFSAKVTKPVVALNSAAKRIAAGDMTVVVPEKGRDEIYELSVSFNKMTRELARLEEAKKRIIADAAHELRTPTTLIRGTIEGMIDGVFPLDSATLRSVHEETLRLSRLIDTLRELELIESGRMKLETAEVDVVETAVRAVSIFAAAAKERGAELSVVADDPRPETVAADPFRLDEVVYNLLSNALKHAGSGGQVRVAVSAGTAGAGVSISVDDSGPGVPVEERDRIFERFYRTDASRCADEGGRGLGLAIVKEIVKAHGGFVSVGDSDLGGASFVVRLPASGGSSASSRTAPLSQ